MTDSPTDSNTAAALNAFAATGTPRLLFITHAWGGGVEQHVATLAALVSDRARVAILRPLESGGVELELPNQVRLQLASDSWSTLVEALKALNFSRVHLHHVHGFSQDILNLDAALGVALDCTLHDYMSVCPQYQLVDMAGRYCGEPAAIGCNACIKSRPHAWQLSIESWRDAFSALMQRAQRVFAPSKNVANKIKGYFPSVNVTLLAHPEPGIAPPRIIKVALLGALSNAKGLQVAIAVAERAQITQSPLVLRLIGHAAEPLPASITASGSYEVDELPKLIASERPDVIWLPSQVPETFSFTLSAAIESGLPIVASDLGALADRLHDRAHASLLSYDASAQAWQSALVAAAAASPFQAVRIPATSSAEERAAFAALYVEHYLDVSHSGNAVASISAITKLQATHSARDAVQLTATERPLLNVFRVGAHGGHRPSLRVVERAFEALPQGEISIVGRTQYNTVDVELQRVNQMVHSLQRAHADERQTDKVQYLTSLQAVQQAHADERSVRQQQFDDALSATNTALAGAELRAQAAREYIAHLEASVQQQNDLNQKIAADRDEVLASTSWRVTLPLRRATRFARRAKHAASAATGLIPRIPVLLRGGIARYRRGGWKNVRDRLAIEFRAPAPTEVLVLPERTTELIKALTIFSSAQTPLLSIVIPVYGQHETTYGCLKSIAEHPSRHPFEIIIMDDCSPDPAATALNAVKGVRILRNEKNLGFIGNVNAAVTHARGEWLIILNNDTIVRPGALDALIDTFDDHKNVGLVGAKLLNADGSVQEAGGIVWRDGSAWNWGRGESRDDPRFNFVRDADFCSGAALALRRDLFADMGGFDAHYAPAYYEDTDLAFRIRARNLRVVYQPAAEIFHLEGISHGRDVNTGIKAYQVANEKKFFERWQRTLASHRENAVEPALEAHRASRSNILIVEACMITPDQDAGSVRLLNWIAMLKAEGHHVSYIADNLDGNAKYAQLLTRIGVEVLHGQFAGSVKAVLKDRGPSLDSIVFCRHYIASQYVDTVRKSAPHARIIFDTVDLHFVREEREAAVLQNEGLKRSAAVTREKELDVIAKSDVTLVVSQSEKTLLAHIMPSSRVEIISMIHSEVAAPAALSEREGILFIGGFRHPPNVDAVQWYAREVLPLLRELLPAVTTTIVGSNMADHVKQLSQPGLDVRGFVEHTEPLLQRARVSIAPLRFGAGIKGKINEAMMYGIPVVATTCAVEGMHLTAEQEVLVADEPGAFAQAIYRAYTDAVLWNQLSTAGIANVRKHFSAEAALPTVRSLFTNNRAE